MSDSAVSNWCRKLRGRYNNVHDKDETPEWQMSSFKQKVCQVVVDSAVSQFQILPQNLHNFLGLDCFEMSQRD
jgi:hypothetical protein